MAIQMRRALVVLSLLAAVAPAVPAAAADELVISASSSGWVDAMFDLTTGPAMRDVDFFVIWMPAPL